MLSAVPRSLAHSSSATGAPAEDLDLPRAPERAPSAPLHMAIEPSELFRLVYRQMHSLAAGRRADLDDLVQTALENVLRSLPNFEGRAVLSTYTYRICYLTLLKSRRWYGRWLRRFSLTASGELPESLSGGDVAEVSLVEQERSRRLRRAVGRLSPKRRAVVVLHDFEGLAIDEIASIVQANVLTVRSRLRDGRKELGALLAKDPYFADQAGQREDGS